MLPQHPDQMSIEQMGDWIQMLVDSRHPEGPRLDYKQELDIGKTSGKREFLKDITSFSNEIGGTLIYGVPEERANKQEAPLPASPFGIESQPGLVERLENIISDAVTPSIPEYRIFSVPISKFPGKYCYLVWSPESWIGPHMVSGYEDNRYYRRGQYRAVRMGERDVEERYRRRLASQSNSEKFLSSDQANYLLNQFGRLQAKTRMILVPNIALENRVDFAHSAMRVWLDGNKVDHPWNPSMYGVTTGYTEGIGRSTRIGIFRNAAVVLCKYTSVDDINGPPVIRYVEELSYLREVLGLAGQLYKHINEFGPLTLQFSVTCPESKALFLKRPSQNVALAPSGTDLRFRINLVASDLISNPKLVLKNVGDEIFRGFGLWNSDCFDANGVLINPRGYT